MTTTPLEIMFPVAKKLLDKFGNPLSDSYCSPRWFTQMLPMVDLDPASNPRSTVRCRRRYSLEQRLDGLKLQWVGSVFLNPPYSEPLAWMEKLREEMAAGRCTQAIILCKHDTSTEWWDVMTRDTSPDQWQFPRRRFLFDEPPELVAARIAKFAERGRSPKAGEKSSTNFCSVVVHHRPEGVPPLPLHGIGEHWVRAA